MLRTFVLLLVMMSFAATGQGGDTTKTSRGAAQALHATGEVSSAQSPEVSNGEPGTGGSGLSDEWKSQALGRGTVDGTATGPSRSDGPAPGQAVTASPMTLAAMGLGVEYERALGDLVAIFASLEGSLLWRGMGGQAGARFYPCGRPMNGVFLDAHGSAFRGQFSGEPYTQFGGGMLVGRSWTLEHGV
ncbi:MAG: hypothetical protein ACT4TC_16590, partial [Myxococcaceae bacterium]